MVLWNRKILVLASYPIPSLSREDITNPALPVCRPPCSRYFLKRQLHLQYAGSSRESSAGLPPSKLYVANQIRLNGHIGLLCLQPSCFSTGKRSIILRMSRQDGSQDGARLCTFQIRPECLCHDDFLERDSARGVILRCSGCSVMRRRISSRFSPPRESDGMIRYVLR